MSTSVPRWEKFKAFFGLSILRYLVVWFSLVPVVYTLLSGLPTPLPIQIADATYEISLGLPFNWQILWLSSLFYLVALFTYLIFCPSFVKDYNTYSDYVSVGHDPRWLAWEAAILVKANIGVKKFVERLSTKGFLKPATPELVDANSNPDVQEQVTTYSFENEGKNWSISMPIMVGDKVVKGSDRGVFWEIYGRYTASKNGIRMFIFGTVITSGLLFLLVLIQHVIAGGRTVYSWLTQLGA